MTRKVCVVTGTRAEFGLLRWLMSEINDHPKLLLQTAVTGMHLSPEFGSTYKEIEDAGFKINFKVDMLLGSDSVEAVTKSVGIGVMGFADAYSNLSPDLVILLGDRFEIFAAATAAMIGGIPIAHIHGGEASEGAFDEAIRHSITKMSHLHFVAADEYRRRVIQLGETPNRVFQVGGMGVDAMSHIDLMAREDLEASLKLKFFKKNLLITFHPITLEGRDSSKAQMRELLSALADYSDVNLIFTMPNADTAGRELTLMVEKFVDIHSNSKFFPSLGQLRYYSCLSIVDGVIGNSSSGLLEAPSFRVGTVNIGERQKGRLKASSVIDCLPNRKDIKAALNKLYSSKFNLLLKTVCNPYGPTGASKLIADQIAKVSLNDVLKKNFNDIPFKIENTQKSTEN
ncbi:UDP-N-acetylglucosamine 2-epimerase [Planktomarina sp.]|nr:UDP-N-acetylglucosamine 2-epimerase [Planktomarina sp.]